MKNILLICSAGITSATLVQKMEEATKLARLDYKVTSASVAEVKENIDNADIIMLSPQASYLKPTIEDLVTNEVEIIILPTGVYAAMDGNEAIMLAGKALKTQ